MPGVEAWSRLTAKERKGTFWSDRRVLYCDRDMGYTVVGNIHLQKSMNYILKFSIFNYICIILNKVGKKKQTTPEAMKTMPSLIIHLTV